MNDDTQFDVTAVGNAIVDVLAQADDRFLSDHELEKGVMSLIDGTSAERLYGLMGPGVEASGGSAANTVAGIAGLILFAEYPDSIADSTLWLPTARP